MQLHAAITDIWGNRVCSIWQYRDLEVIEPLCDTRTAKLVISLSDPAVAHVLPVKRLLKVTYGPFLIFWGHIVRPSFNYDENTCEVNAHDPTFKLKHHYHRYGDIVVDYGYPMDGTGMRQLIESSVPIEPQLDRDIPGNGIAWGVDTAYVQAAKGENNTEPPFDGHESIWKRAERGANVWETITNMREAVGAPEFRFRPVDAEHPGPYGAQPAGFFCEMDTAVRMEEDKTSVVQYEYGFGRMTADNVVEEPDGDVMRNYWVQVYPGGERSRDDEARKALFHDEASWVEYGIMGGWESSGQPDTQKSLAAKAEAWVRAYKIPPTFVTVTPAIDRPGVPVYMQDFECGDRITVRAKKGFRSLNMQARVIRVTVRQVDPVGNTRSELECVPIIALTAEEGGEDS